MLIQIFIIILIIIIKIIITSKSSSSSSRIQLWNVSFDLKIYYNENEKIDEIEGEENIEMQISRFD